MSRVRRAVRREDGTSLIELLTVMLVLGTIVGALTTAFVSGTKAELDSSYRFQGQIDAGVALDRLRRDVHCASAITPVGAAASITLTVPSGCPVAGVTTISWCSLGSGTHYTLYRQLTTACTTGSSQLADRLTSSSVFAYTAPVTGSSLGKLAVDLRVNPDPARPSDEYRLTDVIVLRNTTRS
jgi:hypothetical protein